MKKTFLFLVFLIVTLSVFSQKKDKVLLTIDGEPIKFSEFKRVYEKNLDIIENDKDKDVLTNFELFINYKLKVKEAYKMQLDTLGSYKREIETYRNQLMSPYLQDKEFQENLIKETYDRIKNEVRASHILIRTSKNATPTDTLKAYEKILKARKEILTKKNFKEVAKKYSEDPSVKNNEGDLGYFNAFKMVYPFENVVYNTKVGEISEPFKTRFGYHIVQVTDKRLSKGEVEVAHILITDKSNKGKKKIDSVYQKLKKNISFKELAKQYSNDLGSKDKGGKLTKFGVGRMIPLFEKMAFSLQKEGEFSKPFKTRFGWHIIQLIKKHPVAPFEEMKEEIAKRIKSSGRGSLSKEAVLNKLKKKYKVVINNKAQEILKNKNYRTISKDSLQTLLLTINEKEFTIQDFANYTQNRRHKPTPILLEMFIKKEVLQYYKENLIYTEPAFANTLQEYKDGLLLFELMQRKIWDKSSTDSIGLQHYFDTHKTKYNVQSLEKIKGKVMNDYQDYLEKKWIADLRKKSKIKINKRQRRKMIKFFKKKYQ